MVDHDFTLIEAALLHLGRGERQVRVRLHDLRERLPLVCRAALDAVLIQGQRDGRWVLYREDRTQALTSEDHEAALMVGGCPRHLVLLDVPRRKESR